MNVVKTNQGNSVERTGKYLSVEIETYKLH